MIDLSIVIPVYSAEATLATLVDKLHAVLHSLGRAYEIILVDDASPDSSWRIMQELQLRYGEPVTIVQLMRNAGQHNALMCGFRQCRGDYVITLDDDLQNPPEEIPRLLHAIEESGFDVIYGRYVHKQHSFWRNVGSWLVNAFFKTVFRTRIAVSAVRVVRGEVIQSILSYTRNFTYVDGLLAWSTERVGEVAIAHHPRCEGRSGYSFGKLAALGMNLVTSFSVLPLRLASAIGVLAASAGIVAGTYYLVQYFLANIVVPGFASTIVAVLVLGGLQLLSLGIMGEYLGRMHLNMNCKPQYTVRQTLRGGNAANERQWQGAGLMRVACRQGEDE